VREWTGRGVSGALLYRVISVAASAVVVWNPGARSSRSCKRPAYIKELLKKGREGKGVWVG
jgi:hypothetical protein